MLSGLASMSAEAERDSRPDAHKEEMKGQIQRHSAKVGESGEKPPEL